MLSTCVVLPTAAVCCQYNPHMDRAFQPDLEIQRASCKGVEAAKQMTLAS